MTIVSNLDLIRRVPMFRDLSAIQAGIVSASVQKKRYKRGDLIVEQGRVSDTLFMIVAGKARVLSQDDRGREVIIATLQAGDCLGEMSLIDGQPHSATVRAEVATDALVLGREAFARCLHENAAMADTVMRSLVQRLRQANKQIHSLALMDVYGRVMSVLYELAEEDARGNKVLHKKISRQDVAKMVGASREMVSRVLKHFEENGVLIKQAEGGFLLSGSQSLG